MSAVGKGSKGKKLKDLKAEKAVPSDDAPAGEDAPVTVEEAEEKEGGGEPGTPPLEEAEPTAPTPTAEAEEAPEVKAPEVKAPPPPVKTKEEPKAKVEKLEKEEAKRDDKKEEHSHHDGELMHQHPKDCFLTLWPGILSVFGVFAQPFQRHDDKKAEKKDEAAAPAAEAK